MRKFYALSSLGGGEAALYKERVRTLMNNCVRAYISAVLAATKENKSDFQRLREALYIMEDNDLNPRDFKLSLQEIRALMVRAGKRERDDATVWELTRRYGIMPKELGLTGDEVQQGNERYEDFLRHLPH